MTEIFLDRTVTHMLAPEGDGHWVLYAGGYSDMMAQNKQALTFQRKEIELSHRKASAKSCSGKSGKNASSTDPSLDSAGEKKTRKKKLSYKQVYALEKLPEEIAVLQNEIKKN
ncbi:hypothetical protein MNL09_07995 [Bartonella krasnovii]|nr:hypothetical protein MNL09_07995 [Bartonella krasnovii]